MSDDSKTPHEENWQEVGRQFQVLGESLAQAVRTAWEKEENRQRVSEMRTGLEAMVRDIGKAIDESASSPQGQQLKEEAKRAAAALRSAGEQTAQEVRPQLLNALEKVNEELKNLIEKMK
jgi:hypothetical protein